MARNLSLLLLLFLTLGTTLAFAQSGEIQGKVTDEVTGEGIPFANVAVIINGTTSGAQTDFEGYYSIKPVPPGSYVVSSSYVGYQEQQIEGVLVTSDKITFLDMSLKEKTELLEAVVVKSYKVPLLKADETSTGNTMTKEQIESLPTRNVASIASQAAGVYQEDEGGALNVKGSRDDATDYYIDGIKVRGSANLPASAIEQLTVVTGGVPARYGDATGGIINITTRGPSSKLAGGVEVITSKFLDNFGYYLGNANLSGPLLTLKKGDTKRTVAGFFLSGEYLHEDDDDPSYVGIWQATDETLQRLINEPIQLSPTGSGFIQTAETLTMDDFEKVDTKQNVGRDRISLAGKIDIQPAKNINITLGGNYNFNSGGLIERSRPFRDFARRYEMYNTDHIPEFKSNVWRVFGRFTQRFANAQSTEEEGGSSSFLRNAFYTVQFDYTKTGFKAQDPLFQDRLFEYGYVGEFRTFRQPQYAQNTVGNLQGWEFQGFEDTLVTFVPHPEINEPISNYNQQYFQLAGDDRSLYNNILAIQRGGGLLNGSLPLDFIGSYSLWFVPGIPYNTFRNAPTDQYRLTFRGSFDLKRPGASDRNKHAIEFGFEYEQRINRDYLVNPDGLWNIMQARIAQPSRGIALDLDNPILVIDGDRIPLSDYDGSGSVFDVNDTITYNLIRDDEQSYFDAQFRQRFGYGLLDFVDVDAATPDQLSLDLLSPDELFNGGGGASVYGAPYRGFDYLGNKLNSQPAFEDFWRATETWTDMEGNQRTVKTRPIDASRPIYMAGYVQDKFAFKDLIFNVGVRVDRFDANQKVPKDIYSPLYGVRTASEVTEIGGDAISHPGTVGEDYVVYVDDPVNPSRIVGYRSGDDWFDSEGIATSPTLITTEPKPYLSNPLDDIPADDIRDDDNYDPSTAFEDYTPQVTFMPRVAFSFEISEQAIFFAHYDVLSQRPQSRNITTPYDYYFFESNALASAFENPNLRPERTVDYQIGFKQKLTNTSAITLSGFYRELKDMIQITNIPFAYPNSYNTYRNIDFGTVKGFEVSFDLRRTGNVRMNLGYTMQFADGTGSGDRSQANLISFNQPNLRTIFPLDYDARHIMNMTLDYRFKEGQGPKLFGKPILQNAGANFILRARSGVPYTRQAVATPEALFGVPTRPELEGTINGSRLPWTFRLDARIDKDFKIKFGKKAATYVNVYLLIQNLLNSENITSVYSFTGSPDDDGYIPSNLGQEAAQAALIPESFTDQYALKVNNPNNFSIPRRMRLGLSFTF